MLDLSTFENSSFDRGASRCKELIWWLIRQLFFLHWIPVPSPIKIFFLKLFGAKIGRNVVVRSAVNVSFPWRLQLGDNVWIGDQVSILSLSKVTIGANTCVSQRAFLCTGSHDFESSAFPLVCDPIEIGEGCWVGAQTFLSPGVRLGSGCQVLPGAVVSGAFPDGAKLAGIPARDVATDLQKLSAKKGEKRTGNA